MPNTSRKPVVGRVVKATDPCPHGKTLGTCDQLWCRSRLEDLQNPDFQARPLAEPE